MRHPLPLVRPGAGDPHRIGVVGELLLESDGLALALAFRGRTAVPSRAVSLPFPIIGNETMVDGLDLDLRGSIQQDGVLTVTIVMRLRHPARDGEGGLDAETTVVPAGASLPFLLTCFDDDGCRVTACGVITHEPAGRSSPV